jgi:hypothetical protein
MIKDILVCWSGDNDDTVIATAKLALQHKAGLTGSYFMIDNVNRY